MTESPQDPFLLAFANCPSFGARTLERIHEHFGSFRDAWEASEHELRRIPIPANRLNIFFSYRKNLSQDKLITHCRKEGITWITKADDRYPALLKDIFDPPFILFVKGELKKDSVNVAIVGSRKATAYGKTIAHDFARELARNGITIVSGLAEGVDSAAHEGALQTGKTVAILGSGLLARQSIGKDLEQKILEKHGAIISEFPLYSPGLKHHFPMRNRIIAGMSQAVILPEAGLPSGSLITATCAINEGRDVFAIPGPITSLQSSGTNELIKQGALPATSPKDILERLGVREMKHVAYVPENTEEELIISFLKGGIRHVDELLHETNIPHHILSETLITLELKAIIKNKGGMRYEIMIT